MREVDESLEVMKKDYKRRMDECEERRIQFELKQGKMREQVLKFEKFIQENDAKRQRAELKAKQEKKMFEEKCKELNQLAETLQQLQLQQEELEQELGSYPSICSFFKLLFCLEKKSCYKMYLERVVEEADLGYEEMADILNRYKTLTESNEDLMSNVQKVRRY